MTKMIEEPKTVTKNFSFNLFRFSLIRLAVYLGIGFATQVFLYQDMQIAALFDGSAYFSTYAHILVWWLFIMLWFGKWFLVTAVIVGLMVAVIWGGASYLDYRSAKKAQAARKAARVNTRNGAGTLL